MWLDTHEVALAVEGPRRTHKAAVVWADTHELALAVEGTRRTRKAVVVWADTHEVALLVEGSRRTHKAAVAVDTRAALAVERDTRAAAHIVPAAGAQQVCHGRMVTGVVRGVPVASPRILQGRRLAGTRIQEMEQSLAGQRSTPLAAADKVQFGERMCMGHPQSRR